MTGKRVLVRVDLNVPMQDGAGHRRHAAAGGRCRRARASRPRRDRAAAVAFRAAQGRNAARTCRPRSWCMPLSAAARPLGALHRGLPGTGGRAGRHDHAAGRHRHPREHALPRGEEKNDPELAKAMAALGDYLCQRRLLDRAPRARLDRRHHAFPAELRRPGDGSGAEGAWSARSAIPSGRSRRWSAGAKVSTKLAVLGHLVGKVDHLIIGGGMANTFLAARGVECRQVAVRA